MWQEWGRTEGWVRCKLKIGLLYLHAPVHPKKVFLRQIAYKCRCSYILKPPKVTGRILSQLNNFAWQAPLHSDRFCITIVISGRFPSQLNLTGFSDHWQFHSGRFLSNLVGSLEPMRLPHAKPAIAKSSIMVV